MHDALPWTALLLVIALPSKFVLDWLEKNRDVGKEEVNIEP